jgi:tetratricopeptide (TPR) repeat protein
MLRGLITRWSRRSPAEPLDRLVTSAVAARDTGDFVRAAGLLEQAVAQRPGQVEPRRLLAEIHLARGEHGAAEAVLRETIRIAPDDARAHELLGQALRRRGATLEGSHALLRAIELDGGNLSARSELAAALIDLGRPGDALPLLRWVIKRDPQSAPPLVTYGIALQEMDQTADAVAWYRRAVALEPGVADHRNHLAMCLRALDRHEEAVGELEAATESAPGEDPPRVLLALVLRELGRIDEALAAVRPVVARSPGNTEARCVLAQVLQDLGEVDGARAEFDAALLVAPRSGRARVGRALLRLGLGDFANGWDDYDGRFDSAENPRRGFPFPDWDRGPLGGRTVLVYAEQGLGDEIMFASCLPDLIAEADRVVVECDPRLTALFGRSFPQAAVFGAARTWDHPWLQDAGAIDVQVAAGSLPYRYRRGLEQFPPTRGYLRADPHRVDDYRARITAFGPRMRVGIAWRGGLKRTRRAIRSVSPDVLAPLLARTDVHWVSLQHDASDDEVARFRSAASGRFSHWPEVWSTADEAAALMTALDAVVTVCSSVVHLGGALGVRVLAMVPANPEWRYLRAGERMPWYPSVELLRQIHAGDWRTVVDEVVARI